MVADTGSILPLRFLFRFRNLVGNTIIEHQEVIKTYGSCWWGWWKKPNEDYHKDIWEELADQTSSGAPIPVGLFDSGSGSVYVAHVTKVILPNPDTDLRPEVPEQEQHLIPSYYRQSPYSRAWIRMTKIEKLGIDFFNNYSFAEAPSLPNYPKEVLNWLRGKKIMDANELTGMDTTIWTIRPSIMDDNKEKIVLTTPSISQPISYDVIKVDHDTILHLSDLHYAVGNNSLKHNWSLEGINDCNTTMIEAIANAIESSGKKIGLILITGDLTYCGDKKEFDSSLQGINRLLGILNLSKDHLVIVPGNHDIAWTKTGSFDDRSVINQVTDEGIANYKEFYSKLFRHEPNKHLSMGRRFVFPSGLSVEIAALNSSSLEMGKNYLDGMGRINENAFKDVANTLKWTDEDKSAALRLLILHHHLALTENLEPAGAYYKGFGIAADAPRIQRLAAKYGVQLAIHGHKHRSFIWRSTVYELPEYTAKQHRLGELSIIGGGSSGSSETEGSRNYFNLLDVASTGLTLSIFKSENHGIFEEIMKARGLFEFSSKQPGLSLSDWIIE